MGKPAIRVDGLWRFYGDFPAVRDVSFEVAQGETLALLGRNGAGKTTVLRMLAGLLRPSKGSVAISHSDSALRPDVGMVGHGVWIYDELTAAENLGFFAELYDLKDREKKVSHWLEQAGLMRFRDTLAGEFSRGMRQRLAIARAFLHDPAVLLLDEPWTALDDRATGLLSSLLLNAREAGRTTVICSHQLREALETATQVAVIDRGRLIFVGANREEFRTSPQTFYQQIS